MRLPERARVELPREETCRGFQDLIRPAQLPNLALELVDPPAFLARRPRLRSPVHLGLVYPAPQRLNADAELARHTRDHTTAIAVVLLNRRPHHPHPTIPQLGRISTL